MQGFQHLTSKFQVCLKTGDLEIAKHSIPAKGSTFKSCTPKRAGLQICTGAAALMLPLDPPKAPSNPGHSFGAGPAPGGAGAEAPAAADGSARRPNSGEIRSFWGLKV